MKRQSAMHALLCFCRNCQCFMLVIWPPPFLPFMKLYTVIRSKYCFQKSVRSIPLDSFQFGVQISLRPYQNHMPIYGYTFKNKFLCYCFTAGSTSQQPTAAPAAPVSAAPPTTPPTEPTPSSPDPGAPSYTYASVTVLGLHFGLLLPMLTTAFVCAFCCLCIQISFGQVLFKSTSTPNHLR